MKITAVKAYQIDLPLKEGRYNWSQGNFVEVFDSTVIAIETDAGVLSSLAIEVENAVRSPEDVRNMTARSPHGYVPRELRSMFLDALRDSPDASALSRISTSELQTVADELSEKARLAVPDIEASHVEMCSLFAAAFKARGQLDSDQAVPSLHRVIDRYDAEITTYTRGTCTASKTYLISSSGRPVSSSRPVR